MKPLLALALLVAAPAVAKPATTVDQLGWLAGNWQEVKGEHWTEELWTTPRGGRMIGVGRAGKGAAKGSFEFMRIEADADGTPVFWGAPSAGTPVPFRLAKADRMSVVFENAAHDFPQRISYSMQGDTLVAEVSSLDGKSRQGWTHRKAR